MPRKAAPATGIGLRILAKPIDANPSKFARRKSSGDLLPALAAVVGAIQATARGELLGRIVVIVAVALTLIGNNQQRLRIGRMHSEINDPRFVIDKKNSLPRLAAVTGLVQPAILVRTIQSAQDADIDNVRILGMNKDAANLKRLPQSHVGPTLAAIGRFVHAISIGHGVARIALAGTDPDDVFVRLRHAHIADRHRRLVVELMLEGDAVIGRLQQTAGSSGHPVGGRIGLVDGQRGDTSAHVGRPDAAPG
jgi:hypothetical protein